MSEYLLTQDIGVFSCKGALYDVNGRETGRNTVYYSPEYDETGGASQNPRLWWDAFCENCRSLLRETAPGQVAAVCVTGQMMGCLPLSKEGAVLANSIIWDDSRTGEETALLARRVGRERIHSITGLRSSQSFGITKFMWLKRHNRKVYDRARWLVQCKDYINYRLCGELATDYTDAGFTQAFDLFSRRWSEEMLQAAEIDERKLPPVLPHATVLGRVSPGAAGETGLSVGTKVVLGMGDGRCSVLGSGCVEPGQGSVYLGASSWVSQVTDSTAMDPSFILTKAAFLSDRLYANGGTMLCGRLSADWLAREFFPERSTKATANFYELYQHLDGQIALSQPGCHGLIFMPHLRGERAPWWNDYARGAFLGLQATHTKADLCRSVYEGVAFNLGTIKNNIEQISPFSGSIRLSGACARSEAWQQILADVFDRQVVASDVDDQVCCVGAAVLAGVGAGLYSDYHSVELFHHRRRVLAPIEANVQLYRELLPAFEDCYYALSEINHHLSRF